MDTKAEECGLRKLARFLAHHFPATEGEEPVETVILLIRSMTARLEEERPESVSALADRVRVLEEANSELKDENDKLLQAVAVMSRSLRARER